MTHFTVSFTAPEHTTLDDVNRELTRAFGRIGYELDILEDNSTEEESDVIAIGLDLDNDGEVDVVVGE